MARRLRKEMSPDFACLEARLAIEVDGRSHDCGDSPQRDARRDAMVANLGFTTVRIPARELIHNLEGVVLGIVDACHTRTMEHRR